MFQCPDAPGEGNVKSNLMMASVNYQAHPVLLPNLNGPFWSVVYRCYPISKVRRSSEMALIWDCALVFSTADGVWHPDAEWSISINVDGKAIQRADQSSLYFEKMPAGFSPDDSISLAANFASGATAGITSDKNGWTNRDLGPFNVSNIRFRHINDTAVNVLMVDGHVEAFHYNKKRVADAKDVTDLKRRNLYVNRP